MTEDKSSVEDIPTLLTRQDREDILSRFDNDEDRNYMGSADLHIDAMQADAADKHEKWQDEVSTRTMIALETLAHLGRQLLNNSPTPHSVPPARSLDRDIHIAPALTRTEAVELASKVVGEVSPKTISNWASKGFIKTNAAGRFRYDRKSLEKFLETGVPQGVNASVRRRNERLRKEKLQSSQEES